MINKQDTTLLKQTTTMLDDLSIDERNRGHDSYSAGAACSADAVRPMRIEREVPIHYEATTFQRDAYRGCELQVRRMECFGMLTKRDDGPLQGRWFLDVLDADGDILDTLEVNDKGAKYMRRTLYNRRESTIPSTGGLK